MCGLSRNYLNIYRYVFVRPCIITIRPSREQNLEVFAYEHETNNIAQNMSSITSFDKYFPGPGTDLEKLAADRDTWRSACASGLSTLCQVSDQAAADRRSRRHHRRSPTATGPRCPQCSRVYTCFRVWPAQPPS